MLKATLKRSEKLPKKVPFDDFWGLWESTNNLRLQITVDLKEDQLLLRTAIVRELVGGQEGRPYSYVVCKVTVLG